ncbi:hypothetical protein C0585_08225 [Candidatus Woesearchaeota archaeon]|nr:MAG: hypothetical protein C0585_08225 [Candidatus Woesearchaeota archaeon]
MLLISILIISAITYSTTYTSYNIDPGHTGDEIWVKIGVSDEKTLQQAIDSNLNKVGTLTSSKWCTSDGSKINCNTDQPVTTEQDPQVGSITSGKWCTGTSSTTLSCTSDPPSSTSQWTTSGSNIYYTTGTVGIGTTSPSTSYKLDVIGGNMRVIGDILSNKLIDYNDISYYIDPDGTTKINKLGIGNVNPLEKFHLKDSSRGMEIKMGNVVGTTENVDGIPIHIDGLSIYSDGSSYYVPGIILQTGSGYTGIAFKSESTDTGYIYSDTNNMYVGAIENDLRLYAYNGGNVNLYSETGEIIMESTVILSDGSSVPSDINLKENIVQIPIEKSNKLLEIDGVKYNLKKNGKEEIGFIAQEVEEYFPTLVYTDTEGIKSLDYTKMIVPLLEVVKNQEERIKQLEEDISELKNS